MTLRPPIAVVVTCYNLGRTLEPAVDSVLRQTRPAHEIVVIDDGSEDILSRQVLAALRRPRLRVIATPHQGVASARNTGVSLTSAPHVVLLDADDLLAEEYLERAAATLDADPDLSFVSCAVQAFEGASYRWTPPSITVAGTLARGSVHVSSMFRRTLWDAVGGFDPTLPGYEDLDFWLRALRRGFRGTVLEDVLLNYRVHTGSRYRRAIDEDTYRTIVRSLVNRHRDVLEAQGLEVLAEKQAFLLEIGAHHQWLRQQRQSLIDRIGAVDRAAAVPASPAPSPPALPIVTRTAWSDSPAARALGEFLFRSRWLIRGRVLLVSDAHWLLQRLAPPRWDEGEPWATSERCAADNLNRHSEGSFDTVVSVLLAPPSVGDPVVARLGGLLHHGGTLLMVAPALSAFDTLAGAPVMPTSEVRMRAALAALFPLGSFEVLSGPELVTACVRPGATETMPFWHLKAHASVQGLPGLVVAYHRIAQLEPDSFGLCTSAQTFRAHLAYLQDTCVVLPLAELVHRARSGTLPPRAVALTFDDGYHDALGTAAPILAASALPATFFVQTDRLDEAHEDWHDEIERILLEEDCPDSLHIDTLVGPLVLDLRTAGARKAALTEMHAVLMPASAAERTAVLVQLRARRAPGTLPRPDRRLLLAAEVQALAAMPGVEIGSHSEHHLRLPLHPPSVQIAELRRAKSTLEILLGRSILSLAYPYGEHDERVEAAARDAPTLLAVTVTPGLVSATTDPMRVPRMEVGTLDAATFVELVDSAFHDRNSVAHGTLQVAAERRASEGSTADPWVANDRRSHDEVERQQLVLSARPQFLIIDPTSRCNARCVMCPVSFRAPGDHGTDLGWSAFDAVSQLLPTASHVNLFSSGEPTIGREVARMIAAARRQAALHAKVWVSTNGKRMPADFLDSVMVPGMGLQFSVDGGTREVFEAVRRGIRFDELRRSLETVRARKGALPYPSLAFSSTMSKRNIHDLANIFRLAREYGIEHVMFYDEDPEVVAEEAYILESSDRPEFERQLPDIEATGVPYSNGLTFRGLAGLRATEPPPPPDPPAVHCLAPWKVFHLRADGTVRTCCTLRTSMGNIREQSIDEIWNGEGYVNLRRAFATQEGIPGTCYRCADPLRSFGAEP